MYEGFLYTVVNVNGVIIFAPVNYTQEETQYLLANAEDKCMHCGHANIFHDNEYESCVLPKCYCSLFKV